MSNPTLSKDESPNQVEGKKEPKLPRKKSQKLRWTVARCRKIANRFQTEEEWARGAPSSFKSAKFHGWVEEILRQIATRRGLPQPERNTKKVA